MSKFSGIDLHSNNSVVVVSDETDQIVYERRHANDLAEILAVLEPYRAELVGVVVESTYNWYWLVDEMCRSRKCAVRTAIRLSAGNRVF
jgi:transposase